MRCLICICKLNSVFWIADDANVVSTTKPNRISNSSNRENAETVPPKPVERVDKDTDTTLDYENPLIAQFMRENSLDENKNAESQTQTKVPENRKPFVENRASSLRKQTSSQAKQHEASSQQRSKAQKSKSVSLDVKTTSPKNKQSIAQKKQTSEPEKSRFLRSKTSLDFRSSKQILRNEDGIPFVTPLQRYELTLLLMEDILKRGISGRETQCATAKKLCENLVSFTFSITSAKRRTLEDLDLYFDNRNGVLVEVSTQEKKLRRKKGLERVQNLPGKLDHVSVVAWNVGNFGG